MPALGQRNTASHARPEADFTNSRDALQRLGSVSDDVEKRLRELDQRRTIELVLEQLRGAANAAQWILDLVREAAYQVPIGLLLLQQALLARDLELLVDVSEFQDHH